MELEQVREELEEVPQGMMSYFELNGALIIGFRISDKGECRTLFVSSADDSIYNKLPELLRELADNVEVDIKAKQN